MRLFFDTSVLVPVFVPGHEHHERSLAVFSAAVPTSSSCAAHSLAEVYASLTRLPGRYRASPEQAMTCVETLEGRLTVVALEVEEYLSTIREAARSGIVGGTLYDALLGACALKAGAQIVYTWNARHFGRLGTNLSQRVRTP